MRGIEETESRNGKARAARRAPSYAVELNATEMLLLFTWYGPGPVLGIENIFQNMALEQVEEAHRGASMALRRRGILRLDPDGKIAVHKRVEEVVRACYRPEHTLILRVQQRDEPPRYEYVHFLGELVVQHTQPRRGRHLLALLTDREAVASILMTEITGGRSFPPAGSSFSMPERALFDVRDLCRSGREKSALDRALHYCPERASASRLVDGLRSDPVTHSLVLLAHRGSADLQHVTGFSVLTSPSGLWALRSDESNGESWVEVTPTDPDGIRQRLEHVLPDPVVRF